MKSGLSDNNQKHRFPEPHPILVASKLSVPKGPARPLDRPRISTRLDEDARRLPGLTVVSAPPGYGKTSAVIAWLRKTESRGAWFGLDALDNDPKRFLVHLIASVRKESERFGESLQSLPTALRLPSPEFLASLIANEISDLSSSFSYILDDYHEIQNPYVHEIVEGLIRFQPRNLHLVILTRVDPPFPLARYRVEGRMTEFRAKDLLFTIEETGRFLDLTSGITVDQSSVNVLWSTTEGWPAALQLCALSLQNTDSQSAETFVKNFSGQDRYIVDYLAEEVLQRQNGEIVDFLLETSVLERFSAELCDWVRGKKNSRGLLDELKQRNLFLVPLDTEGSWYRYHPLFSNFLCVRVSHERRRQLHLRAAEWFDRQNMPALAVKHAVQSGDSNVSGQVINRRAEGAFRLGYHALLGSWLESLSEEFIRSNFELALYKAWILFLTGKIQELKLLIGHLDSGISKIENTESYGRYLSLKAWLARSQGDLVDKSLVLPHSDSHGEPIIDFLSHLAVGQAAFQEGRTEEAVELLDEAYRLERQAGNSFAALCALHNLCFYLLDNGKRKEVQRLCVEALDVYTDSQGEKLPISGMAYLPLAASCYEANALEQAREYSETGLVLCRNLNLEDILVEDGTRTLALVHIAEGRLENALSLLSDTLERYQRSNLHAPLNSLLALQAEIAIRQGDLRSAQSWADRRGFDPNAPPSSVPGYEHLTYVRLLLTRNRLEEASAWLSVFKESCERSQRGRMLLSVLLLRALWFIQAEQAEEAQRIVKQTLMIASPQEYRRPFLDEFPALEPIVLQCRQVAPDFVDSLQVSLKDDREIPVIDFRIEPLSKREQEVLRLAAEALTNREIADRLFISVGTVKWHMNHILAKLNVATRSKAASKARELGLL